MTYCMTVNSRSRKNYEMIFVSQSNHKMTSRNCLILLGFLVGPLGLEPRTKGL